MKKIKKHIKKNTMVRKLLDRYGEDYLRTLWEENGGATKAAKIISDDLGWWVTEARFNYLAKLYNWKRKIRKDHPLALGVQRGNHDKEKFPHIIFPGDIGYE